MDVKDLGQLKEMQKRLLKKQCDLDIQKAMVKAFIKKEESKKLTLTDVVKTLPNKNAAICEGYNKASMQDYQNRNILGHKDKDNYYSGWMDCYDWISKGN